MRHIILVAILLSCGPTPAPVPVVDDTALCGAAEQNLEKLQCTDMAGNPMWINLKGERFETVCNRAQEEGGIYLNPRCIMGAKSCEEAKECPNK